MRCWPPGARWKKACLLYTSIQYFNKKQQQSLLEFMENGKITLIASTTAVSYTHLDVYKRQMPR